LLQFAVVRFAEPSADPNDDDDVISYEVVSTNWLVLEENTKTYRSYWPPPSVPDKKIIAMIKSHTSPDKNEWQCIPCDVKSTYGKSRPLLELHDALVISFFQFLIPCFFFQTLT
jgi:hypothetical protein